MVADRLATEMSKQSEVDGGLIYVWLVYIFLQPRHNQYLFPTCLLPVLPNHMWETRVKYPDNLIPS